MFGVFKNYNIKNGAILAPFFIVFCCYYASLIAPTGQPSSHAPQSMHCSGSTTYLLSPSAIAPTGQVSAHAPHWMQSSPITLGIVFSPYKNDLLSLGIILAQTCFFDKHKCVLLKISITGGIQSEIASCNSRAFYNVRTLFS